MFIDILFDVCQKGINEIFKLGSLYLVLTWDEVELMDDPNSNIKKG